jgi:hypothetical protein
MKIIVFWEIDYGNYIQYKRIMALKKSNGFFFCFLFFVFSKYKQKGRVIYGDPSHY